MKNMWPFYKALLKNPRAIGSITPSSPYLARKIAEFVPVEMNGFVIELGAGTGVITRALLQQGVAHHQLIAIDASADLVNAFRERFPQVKIIYGNANHLAELLNKENLAPIKTIVSSIPLLTYPTEEINNLIQEIEKVLLPGGYYIQYTYGIKKSVIEFKKHFKKIATARVWLNIPPARIDVFQFVNNRN